MESLIGASTVSRLTSFFGVQPDEFRLRRVVADDTARCIPFHTDFSRRTMQVPLNDESEHDGGHLVFATRSGLQVASRAPGSATIHTSGSVHGVTKLHSGARYSLFLAMLPNGGEEVDLQYLVEPALAQVGFFERALPFLQNVTDERLLEHVHAYHEFLLARAQAEHLQPSFEAEVVWRAHLLSPVDYAKDCATILGRDEPTVLKHFPLPASEYEPTQASSSKESSRPASAQGQMPSQWYEALAAKTRRGSKYMESVLALRHGELRESQWALKDEVATYIQFLRDVSTVDLATERSAMRVPGLLVDLVWHTHLLYPHAYGEDCVRIGGRIFDHVQDSDDEDGGDGCEDDGHQCSRALESSCSS